jgi:hypothetical protein
MEQDKRTIPHRQVGLQVVQPFINTGMSIRGDRVITIATLVSRTVPVVLHFNLECSPEGTLLILRNVELHHHVTVHRFCVSPRARCTLNLVTVTLRSVLRCVAGLTWMQEFCAI